MVMSSSDFSKTNAIIMNFQLNKIVLLIGLYALPVAAIAQIQDSTRHADSLKNSIEKVNIAYGRQNKDQVTSATASVTGAELRKTHTASLTNALIGKLTGV